MTPRPDEPTQLERVIAARLEALIVRAGTSVRAVSLQIGRKAHDLHRRLSLDYTDRRPLRWIDVAEILDAIGEPPLAVCDPVLIGPDLRVLEWVDGRGTVTGPELVALYEDGAAALARLCAQDLVREDAGRLTLTSTGRRAVSEALR